MLELNYNKEKSRFDIVFTEKVELEIFNDILIFFKRIYLSYDKYVNNWYFKENRIDEILLWFKNQKIDYELSISAFEKIKQIKNNYKKELIISRGLNLDKTILNNNVNLFNFQEENCNWHLKRNRSYIADDPGLGKTLESIAIMSTLYKNNFIDSIFIIVRSGLEYNWKYEILTFSNIFKEENIQIIHNNNKQNIFNQYKDKKILIIQNHLLAFILSYYKTTKSKKLSNLHWNTSYVDIKKEWNKNNIYLIVDEFHEFKNPDALKTKALISHKQFFDRRLLISATPFINKFEHSWTACNLIDESILEMSYNAFKLYISKQIGDSYSMYNITEYNEEKIEQIRQKFNVFFKKTLKKDLQEMKTKTISKTIRFEFTSLQRKLYEKFFEIEIEKLENEYDYVTLRIIMNRIFAYYIQIIDNPLLLEEKIENVEFNDLLKIWKFEDDPRTKYLDSTLNSYIGDLNEKIIIFDYHPKTLNLLENHFKKYNPLVIHGELKDTNKDREYKRNLFNDKNSKYKLFLLQTAISGAGFNLHYACHREIYWTLPNDATLTQQSMNRISRITSEYDALIEILLFDHSIDLIRYNRNFNRIELNDKIFNKELSRNELKNLLKGII